MEIERKITVELTPEEVSDILKKHLKEKEGFNIEAVYFNIETIYASEMDQHGSIELSVVRCEGLLTVDD